MKEMFLKFFLTITFFALLSAEIVKVNEGVKGNGNVKEEIRSMASFREVVINGSYNVLLKQGKEEKIKIKADDNIINLIETKVNDGKLIIETKEPIEESSELTIEIILKEISSIEINGSEKVACTSTIITKDLRVISSGSAEIELLVNSENLFLTMNGAESVKLKGKAQKVDALVTGAGNLDATKLLTNTMKLFVAGAGHANVNVKNDLDVVVNGSSYVTYKGNPKIKKVVSETGSFVKN